MMTQKNIRLAVAGAAGRMGRTLGRIIHETSGVELTGAIERPQSPFLNMDFGELAQIAERGVAITDNPASLVGKIDGIIDFTTPQTSVALAAFTAQTHLVHVIGTTGLSETEEAAILAASKQTVIIKSGNMSLGVNLLAALVKKAAEALGPEFDIEIVEMHHRAKVDAPSGTALLLGEAAANGRNIPLKDHSIRARDGHTGPRTAGDIGFASLRGGSVVGDHSVILASEGERISLSHHAESRDIFARGAVKAAVWGFGKKAGIYSMADVLGLS